MAKGNRSTYRVNRIIFSDEQVKDIINLYQQQRLSHKNIGLKYNCSSPTIKNLLKKYNIPVNKRPVKEIIIEPKRITHQEILDNLGKEKVAQLYLENETIYKTSAAIGVGDHILIKYLKDNNIKYSARQKYTCNDNFFSTDSEESFYWAGFIAADGNVEAKRKDTGLRSNRICIRLMLDDIDHLYKFKKDIHSTAPIRTFIQKEEREAFLEEYYYNCRIRFNSAQMVSDLLRFNIVPNKSLIYIIPDWLFKHPLVNHFIRGMIDGDGGIYADENVNNCSIHLAGTPTCVQSVFDFLKNKLQLKSGVWGVRDDGLGGFGFSLLEDNKKIVEYLYKGCNVYLDRKQEKAFNVLLCQPRKLDIDKQVFIDLLKENPLYIGKIRDAYDVMAEKLNVSPSTIMRRLVEFDLYHPIKFVGGKGKKLNSQQDILDGLGKKAIEEIFLNNNKSLTKTAARLEIGTTILTKFFNDNQIDYSKRKA
jgi:hypothetical protein